MLSNPDDTGMWSGRWENRTDGPRSWVTYEEFEQLRPLLFAIAASIKLTSRGPVLFRSSRPGIGGQPFDCLKFRTMQSNAEHRQAELEGDNEASGPLFKIRSDPRLTPIGGFLRKTSIDELPQLFNVVGGSMSLVGPRPEQGRLETANQQAISAAIGRTLQPVDQPRRRLQRR